MLVDWKVKLVLRRCADEADDQDLKQEPGSKKQGEQGTQHWDYELQQEEIWAAMKRRTVSVEWMEVSIRSSDRWSGIDNTVLGGRVAVGIEW